MSEFEPNDLNNEGNLFPEAPANADGQAPLSEPDKPAEQQPDKPPIPAVGDPQPEPPPDPFSLDAISLGDDFADGFMDDEGGTAAVPVRKPARDWFFRCHTEHFKNVKLLEVKDGPDRGIYMVARPLWETLIAADLPLKPFRLTLATARDVGFFLWPVKLPEHENRKDDWTAAGMRIAKIAETTWVRMFTKPGANAYSYKIAPATLPDPIWPSQSFQELVDLAFEGKKISDRNDPLVRRLLGEE